MKIAFFWNMVLTGNLLPISSWTTLKKEAACSSKTPVKKFHVNTVSYPKQRIFICHLFWHSFPVFTLKTKPKEL